MDKDAMDKDKTGKDSKQPVDKNDDKMPPAGPHARPDLIDQEKTPGTGILPDPEDKDAPMQPTG